MRPLSLSLLLGTGWILPTLTSYVIATEVNAQNVITEEVVVTGTRTEQSVWDAPVKVSLVNRDQIEKLHAKNAYEAIQHIPGLDFKQPRGKEGQSVWIQGVSANRVLVLIDGEPVSPSTGSTVDITQIPTSQIERIEIVKGSVSALYGSQAIGGVVNIITRRPDSGIGARFSMDVGSWGERDVEDGEYSVPKQRYDGYLSYANSLLAIQTGVNAILSNSFLSDQDDFTKPAPKGDQISSFAKLSFFQTEQLTHKIGYEYYFQDWVSDYLFRNGGNSLNLFKTDKVDRHTYRYDGEFFGEINTIKWGATYEQFINESAPKKSEFRRAEIDYLNLDAQWDVEIGIQQITQGLEYNYNTLASIKNNVDELPDSEVFRSIEYYFQDHMTIGSFQILPGFRYQYDNLFGGKLTPKINARLDIIDDGDTALFLRAGVGQGYRVPNLKELYHLFDHSGLGYIIYGSPDLKPESSINYQIELGLITSDNFAVSANLFYNDMTDMIEPEFTGEFEAGVAISRYKNIEKARIQGVEINAQAQISSWLSLNGGYSYIDAQNLTQDRRLAKRPRHQAKTSIEVSPFDALSFLSNARFVSDQLVYDTEGQAFKTQNFTVFDIKTNYAMTDNLSLYGGIDNLTDVIKDHSDHYDDRPRDGRYYYTGFTLTY
ncbi:MAG: TonB-dependent receptor [Cellvibrionales bacterium]|nr:TonB-dependent receptor [Cellvibrionales bacterium]